ncbi:MAG: secretin and TonB N-terminal domain-containing protein, partial [Dysgonamonadaceae bacterium]|nr:secretin and TonB N-terminal domain-containing protein [Dysgonamonadaceae bacterium]
MRISLILLFVFAFQINAEHARSQSTKISLDMKNSSIEKVLQTIEEKSDYYFLYSNRLINVDRIVSLKVKNAAISSVLDRLFTSHDVEYEVKGSQIILSPKEISEITNDLLASKQQQGKTITGTIVDAQGEAIIGANIIEAGTTNGTVTDFDGNFRLNV